MLILLDLDGTLTDPYDGITRSVAYALDRMGLPGLDERELRSFIGPPLQDRFVALGLDGDGARQAVDAYRERFSERGWYENRVYDGVEPHAKHRSGLGVRRAQRAGGSRCRRHRADAR